MATKEQYALKSPGKEVTERLRTAYPDANCALRNSNALELPAAAGSLTIHLDVDGPSKSMMRKEQNDLSKPHGVTGLVYLQATAPSVKAYPLAGTWQAASSFNRLLPVKSGEKAKCVYLETRFRLPQTWPARRFHP